MKAPRTCVGMLTVLLLAGCAATTGQGPVTGRVAGRLLGVGGPTGSDGQPSQRPMPGTVSFTSAGHRRVTVRVGNSGLFSVQLPPGRYQVSGPCPQSWPVTVTAHRTTHVNVICILHVGSPPSA
jgi:hypothetical protein